MIEVILFFITSASICPLMRKRHLIRCIVKRNLLKSW
ncbi:TPA_asm: ankyrin repeat-containing protein [Vaccinia virus]|nr:TPA_asm: ankyrin repeat-containing protein [Vaccinia virus]